MLRLINKKLIFHSPHQFFAHFNGKKYQFYDTDMTITMMAQSDNLLG
ncbi:hypothetical protein PTUN_a3658 [Pseudoalteromonas tunicata]|uniref:Uncharacterized protein n=1 Tax=Pseudoalteromonas tunicata D2 TaxID=87626 RepID=A4C7M4_9GAMM|nr:hypothetical protein PTUN_a3658 [Pseudoalteromonas tunicata]EAR29978.1 hypothetical protein PTD2_14199 [Pseudoalteromonas tunicata D2]